MKTMKTIIFNPLYKTCEKSYCYYCEKSYNNGYFKKHIDTKKHKINVEKGEGFMLKRTKKYNYNLNILLEKIKEKWLVKDIERMSVELDIKDMEEEIKSIDGLIKERKIVIDIMFKNWIKEKNRLYGEENFNSELFNIKINRWSIGNNKEYESIRMLGFEKKLIENLIFEIKLKYDILKGREEYTDYYNYMSYKTKNYYLLKTELNDRKMEVYNRFNSKWL